MDLFLELLQVSLGTRNVLSRVPSDAEWLELLREAQKQCVSGLLMDGLERLPSGQMPPKKLLLQWIGIAQMTEATYSVQCKRAKGLTEIFNEAGYKTSVLKGIGFSQMYPNPAHRQGGDIDLWVKGRRKDIVAWLKARYEVEHMLWHHIDAKFFEDVPTEIHYHPCWMYNPFCNKRLQKWFDSQCDEQMRLNTNLGFAYPTIQFNAVYALVHFYHHLIEEGIGIRHLIDYFYITKLLHLEDRDIVVGLWKRFGLYRLATAVMWVLKDVCGLDTQFMLCEPNEKEGRFLLDEMMRGGNFGHDRKDNRQRNSAVRMFALLPHYPREVLWVVPWKIWHRCWMIVNA